MPSVLESAAASSYYPSPLFLDNYNSLFRYLPSRNQLSFSLSVSVWPVCCCSHSTIYSTLVHSQA